MAGIDKTYTDSYANYKEFKDWADTQKVKFFDGHTVCIGDYVWDYEESDFVAGHEIPIMNTPTWMDIYLIQNCKSKFVLDRMHQVYNSNSIEEFKKIDLSAPPAGDFKQNRKVHIRQTGKFRVCKKPIGGGKWWVQVDYKSETKSNLWYNEETKTWAHMHYYPTNTNTSHVPSMKALVRHLRKQYLPKGIVFRISGRYVGEDYIAVIS